MRATMRITWLLLSLYTGGIDAGSSETTGTAETVSDPSAAVGDPSTTVGDPSAAVGDPSAAVGDPSAAVGDPSTTVSNPLAAGGDPSAAGADPSTTVSNPLAAGGDPSAAVGDPSAAVGDPSTTVSNPLAAGGDPSTTVSNPLAAGGDPSTTVGDPLAAGGAVGGDPSATVSDPLAAVGGPPATGSDTTGTGVTGGDVTAIQVTTETASKPTPTPTSETSQHGTMIKGSAAITPTMATDKGSSSEPQQSGAATTKPLTPSNSGSHVEQPSSPAVPSQDGRPTLRPNVPPGNPGSVITVPPGVPDSSKALSGPIGQGQDATGSVTQSTTISKDDDKAGPPGVPGSSDTVSGPAGQGQDAAGSATQSTTISKDSEGAGAVANVGTVAPMNMEPRQTTAGTPRSAGGAVIPGTISTRPAGDKAVISPGQAAAPTTQAPPATSLSATTTTTTTTTTLAQPRMFSFSLHEGQEREDEKELVAVCKRLMEDMHVGNCTLVWRQHKGKTVIDSAELNGKVKAALANQYFAEITKKSHDNTTLIAILASCGALLAMIIGLAIYASHHCKPYNENQQHLTEELHTVENGYHDNPTLEVMEVQPEMQEKKVALNGEFNDSWIVPMDNLLKEDMPDEEDTHL